MDLEDPYLRVRQDSGLVRLNIHDNRFDDNRLQTSVDRTKMHQILMVKLMKKREKGKKRLESKKSRSLSRHNDHSVATTVASRVLKLLPFECSTRK